MSCKSKKTIFSHLRHDGNTAIAYTLSRTEESNSKQFDEILQSTVQPLLDTATGNDQIESHVKIGLLDSGAHYEIYALSCVLKQKTETLTAATQLPETKSNSTLSDAGLSTPSITPPPAENEHLHRRPSSTDSLIRPSQSASSLSGSNIIATETAPRTETLTLKETLITPESPAANNTSSDTKKTKGWFARALIRIAALLSNRKQSQQSVRTRAIALLEVLFVKIKQNTKDTENAVYRNIKLAAVKPRVLKYLGSNKNPADFVAAANPEPDNKKYKKFPKGVDANHALESVTAQLIHQLDPLASIKNKLLADSSADSVDQQLTTLCEENKKILSLLVQHVNALTNLQRKTDAFARVFGKCLFGDTAEEKARNNATQAILTSRLFTAQEKNITQPSAEQPTMLLTFAQPDEVIRTLPLQSSRSLNHTKPDAAAASRIIQRRNSFRQATTGENAIEILESGLAIQTKEQQPSPKSDRKEKTVICILRETQI